MLQHRVPLFITLEGIDCCGKTTQAKALARHMETCSFQPVLTHEPGGTLFGEKMKVLLQFVSLDSEKNISPTTELLLFLADRIEHTSNIIKPALEVGATVICDRFIDSSIAYQGIAMGIGEELVQILHDVFNFPTPDLTFILDLPIDEAAKRMTHRKIPLSNYEMKINTTNLANDIRNAYIKIANQKIKRYHLIDATLNQDEITKQIIKIIHNYLPEPFKNKLMLR